MTLTIYLILICLIAYKEAELDNLKINAKQIINHPLSWMVRAVLAIIPSLFIFHGLSIVFALLTAGGLFGALFMILLNLRRDLPFDYISSDPRGSKIDYFFWKLGSKYISGGKILLLTYLVIAVVSVVVYSKL